MSGRDRSDRAAWFPGAYRNTASATPLDPGEYPIITDFIVEPSITEMSGIQMVWRSASKGVLTTFPWWDHLEADGARMDENRPPVGRIDRPFVDHDQGRTIWVWEHDAYVYVASAPGLTVADGWYRVGRDAFMAAWVEGVRRIRSLG